MKRTTLALLLLFITTPLLHAQQEPGSVRSWTHTTSDIPVNPRYVFGHLENGLRWVWTANAEPKERSYLRLHVDVGSLAETDSQAGMAHFLEHMAFNGSKHYPAGTLIEWFQEHGMAFGADTNAHTSFSETVYKLDLPNSDEETLRSGLSVLRDFADGLLLEEDEVEAEKGVIDGEERESDSAGYRALIANLELMYGGTRYPDRLPIGNKAARDAFTSQSVRAFYEAWYRPENMTLVLVGDLGELDPLSLFEAAFGDMAVPKTPIAQEPSHGTPTMQTLSYGVYEPELPKVSLNVQVLRPYVERPVSKAVVAEELPEQVANAMLNLRLREIAKIEDTQFLSARAMDAEDGLDVFTGGALGISSDPEKWREALAAADTELRRALEFGFQQAELDEVRANMLRGLGEAVEREATRSSQSVLREVLEACERPHVPTNATTDQAIARPLIEALTVEACHAALVELWSGGALSVTAVGNLDLGADSGEALSAALAAAREGELQAGGEIAVQEFAYAVAQDATDARGEIVAREHVEDLDVHLFRFANGVLLNVKSTDFKQRQILISARIAEGGLTLERDDFALNWASEATFNGGGLGAHSEDELRRLTAGKQVGASLDTANDAFVLRGSTTPDDLMFELELMRAYVTDPGWRDEGLRRLMKEVPFIFEDFQTKHQGPLITEFLPELFSGDVRMINMPRREAIDAVTLDAIRAWMTPEFANGPIEITVVGEVDVEAVADAVALTFGTLPERRAVREHAERREVPAPRAGVSMERTIRTEIPKALVFMAVPTTDGFDTERRRNLGFLGTIVDDRLRLDVRERLGASYAPGASAQASRVYPGIGLVTIQAMSDPDKVERLVDACNDVLRNLAEKGVTEEEVHRLAEPVLARLRDARRQNGFWLGSLAQAQTSPEDLEEIRTALDFYRNLSAEELSKLAAQYLAPERASTLVVAPERAAQQEAAPEALEAGAPKEDAQDGDGER